MYPELIKKYKLAHLALFKMVFDVTSGRNNKLISNKNELCYTCGVQIDNWNLVILKNSLNKKCFQNKDGFQFIAMKN